MLEGWSMFFKKFFVGALLTFGLMNTSVYALDDQISICVPEVQIDPQITLEYLQYISNNDNLTRDFSAEKNLAVLLVNNDGNINRNTLFSVLDNENPNFNISELKLAGSAKDQKFEDYMKAKIRYFDFKNMLLKTMAPTDKIIDEFNDGQKNTIFEQRLINKNLEYTQLRMQKNQEIEASYKGTIPLGVDHYKLSDITLSLQDMLESAAFPALDILFAKYKEAAKGIDQSYELVKLQYDNFANANANTSSLKSLGLSTYVVTIGVESVNMVKTAAKMVTADSDNMKDQLQSINGSIGIISKNISAIKKILDGSSNAITNRLDAITYLSAINEDLRVLENYESLISYYAHILNKYDMRIVAMRRAGTMVDMAANISKLVSLFPVTSKLDTYTTYVDGGFKIFSALTEELIGIVGVADGDTNTFKAKRKYQAAVEQLAYIAYYDYKIKDDILRYAGEEMKPIFIDKGYMRSNSSNCWDINLKGIAIEAGHLSPMPDTKEAGFTTTPTEGALAPIVRFTLPINATAIDYKLTAPQGKTVSFEPLLSAKGLIECMNTAKIKGIADGVYYETANADLKWKLWYSDATTGIGGREIPLQREGNGFSFTSPKSSSVTLTSLTYSTEGKRDYHSCQWDNMVWQSTTVDNDSGNGDANTTAATYPLKHTGQTTSYAVGDDAHYHAGVQRSYSRSEAGVVTDNVTKLEWQDDYSDNSGSIKSDTWQGAIDYCSGLGLDGGGWRLPTRKELASLSDYGRYAPAIDPVFTQVTSSHYWSSTTHAFGASIAWFVNFYGGYQSFNGSKADSHYVRCVRSGH